MKRYEILEHKADLKIRVFGRNKKELFLNALFGMSESQRPEIKKPEEKIKREISVKSPDLSALLVDFLNEVLYLSQVNKEIYRNIKFKKLTDRDLDAEIFGEKAETFGEDIKAVTYHNLEIGQKTNKGWEAIVLFDI